MLTRTITTSEHTLWCTKADIVLVDTLWECTVRGYVVEVVSCSILKKGAVPRRRVGIGRGFLLERKEGLYWASRKYSRGKGSYNGLNSLLSNLSSQFHQVHCGTQQLCAMPCQGGSGGALHRCPCASLCPLQMPLCIRHPMLACMVLW